MEYINYDAKVEARKQTDNQIEHVRSLVKSWANKVVVGGFYKKEDIVREEGDVWQDADGRSWTKLNGIIQQVSKTQHAKTPWWCPKCERTLNNDIHVKFYWLRGACLDCWSSYETKMKLAKVYDAFERRTLRNNERAWIADIISQHLDYIENQGDMEIHFMDGRWEVLAHSSNFDEMKEKLQADIQFMYDRLMVITNEETLDADEQQRLTEWEIRNPWGGKIS
jgi:hypothetical protein